MEDTAFRAIAIVGVGCVMPDAPNVPAFWQNLKNGRYSITEVPPERWDPALYYDPDPKVPDKTYSKIGGWVREHPWDPVKWRMPIPPRVAAAMDLSQQWGIACTREALEDYGYPNRPLDLDRTAVIVGNAMGGEMAYLTSLRLYFPEYARELAESKTFAALPEAIRRDIARELRGRIGKLLPEVTEDSMPGELANCLAGRIANLYNLHGPNYTADAACASAMAAITSAANGLVANDFDVAIAGGVDRNMGAPTFVKFCKIGALSATGSRPFAEGADGFVMGEGAAIFLMKRLADAERDGDKIYAVLRGIAGSSDGKGKGITAPNPIGQKFAIERAWQNAGLSPATVSMIEGHGTSTRVGDAVEVESMISVLGGCNLPAGSVALGSVKSNIGHLKGGAGAAGMLKAALALKDKVLPPSVNCPRPNPNIDFAHSPLYVNTELRPWTVPAGRVRTAGLSAFGFGGTNFHAVLEEYVPHRLNGNGKRSIAVGAMAAATAESGTMTATEGTHMSQSQAREKAPLRGALVIGAATEAALAERLRAVQKEAEAGRAPAPAAPALADLRAPERVVIDYSDAAELADKAGKAVKALAANQAPIWKALRAQGVFRGQGPACKVAFLYTGQGSQYVNMMKSLRDREPVVAQTFADADRVMTPLVGKPLSDYIFVDGGDAAALAKAEEDLRQTAITQPAVIATDIAFTRLLAAYGIVPDMAMGHSVGEYGALVASGALPFEDAIEAVSARGREMTRVSWDDNGKMVAVFAPLTEIERIVKTIDGYVVTANINSNSQAVIGGTSKAIEQAMEAFLKAGYNAVPLPVSHAFHTSIVAPASEPLLKMLKRLRFQAPRIPIITNVTGKFYPTGPDVVPQMLDLLSRQVASPVQFVEGLNTLYEAGARVFVETGPKKALQGFADDVLGGRENVVALFTNHPKIEEITAFNQTLCGLYAAGLGQGRAEVAPEISTKPAAATAPQALVPPLAVPVAAPPAAAIPGATPPAAAATNLSTNAPQLSEDRYAALGRMFADVLDRGWQLTRGQSGASESAPVAITGAALGLPGTERIFDDGNVGRILGGQQFIDVIPNRFRQAMADKHITRLVKTGNGGPAFEAIDSVADVLKLAGRGGAFDLEKEFGVSNERIPALDRVTQLAMAAGLDALRDAGIPLVMHYKTTSKGTLLPDRWILPEAMRDDTGVIFGSGFPGYDAYADEMARYYKDRARRQELATLEDLRGRWMAANGNGVFGQELDRRIEELRAALAEQPYVFDRRFLFRVLSMGHSQFAELIGARGPNTAINAACATTTQGVALAEDWIRAGRCRRVIIIAADDVTSDHLMEWMGAGFLATGAAATDAIVEEAAVPFDRRRHGMIIGMGAAALVVESAEAVRERGIRPICEVLGTVVANSAFHGTRLDVHHISGVMEAMMAQAEARAGISRQQIAPQTVFMSHETYTPARGGSASAEVNALRRVFGPAADSIVVANTKGFTGHAMGAGIEDVVAVKALETGCVPPVANFKEVDPDLGPLNLSKGGSYPVEYALRLAAGFGSQICMSLLRWVKPADGARQRANALGYGYRIADQAAWDNWLTRMTGRPAAQLEVAQRTLRVRDTGAAFPAPAEAQPPKAAAMAAAAAQAPALPVTGKKPSPPALTLVEKPAPKVEVDAPAPPSEAPKPVANVEAPKTVPAPLPAPAPGDPVKERILALVVEKTGYPQDMLDLELDLEADLGVDTVKQAELLASIRGIYDIPRDENLKLRDFPTLSRVIQFVYDRRPDLVQAKQAAAVTPPATPAPVQAQAPAQAQSPTPAPQPSVVAEGAGDPVKERILELVVEKTGYPKDMLDLELDLEADLGVDTVKQAELLASVRGIYDIPRDENLKLRDFPTLARVIQFVYDRRPDLAQTKTASVSQAAPPAEAPPLQVAIAATVREPAGTAAGAADPVQERVLDLVVEKTGYPKDMLDLGLDLEADLGIDTVKQAELLASIRGIYEIPRDENLKLRDFPTLAHVIQFVYDRRPDLAAAKAPAAGASSMPSAAEPMSETPTSGPPLAGRLGHGGSTGLQPGEEAGAISLGFSPGASPAAPAVAEDSVRDRILELVVEKTGYPKDMLDLGLDLEADLGVDTVKQAELISSIRAIYDIPRDESLKLRDYPTLGHVIQFVYSKRPELAATAGATASAEPQAEPAAAAAAKPALAAPPAPALGSLDAANSIPRRVPVPNLRPPLAVCKPTGVALNSGQRIVLMPDRGGVAEALTQQLQARGVEVLRIEGTPDADTLTGVLKGWEAGGPIQGVYWLPALDNEGSLTEMDLGTWREALRLRLKSLYTTMRALYEQIAVPGTFLVSATRLGGQHGYDGAGAIAPLGGPVVGFTKTYKRERMEALVKAVDFELDRSASEVAGLLLEETLRDPGAVEIGYKNGQRWTIGLDEQPAADGQPGITLDKDTVFVITGAAGGIVSAITADLAAASGGTFYLLDLVPEPDPQNPDLKRFATDREGLKRDLIARIQARGERATPALVERELAALERAVAAWKAIEAVQNAGGTAHYLSVNLTDAGAVAKVIDRVRERSGRIDVLLHAAGMERSHFLPDKDPREFDLVFDVKSDGWFNLLHAIGDLPLGATVAFSSIAGRFGNGGQADYSSANDLLCKITSSFRTVRPATRGIVIDWTAWGGIGMATRGSIPKMMEVAGIDMLPPEAGIPTVRRELTAGATRGEVVVAQRLGILVQEFDATGGLDPAALEGGPANGPMIGRIARMGLHSGLTIQTTLDPKLQPFLYDHQIEGTPVLPGVMGIEAFAEAALRLLPGWQIEAVEDVNFLAPFKFYRQEPREVTVEAVFSPQGDGLLAECRLIGSRRLANQEKPQVSTHFTACVRLAQQAAEPEPARRGKSRRRSGVPSEPASGSLGRNQARAAKPAADAPLVVNPPSGASIVAADIYKAYFHGPAYQVLEQAWRDGDRIVGLMSHDLPPNHQPPELPLAIAPRLIEFCFQTAGLWELGVQGRMGLPLHAHQVCLLRSPDLAEGRRLYAVVTPDPEQGSFDVEVVDEAGTRYLQLSGYRTVALPTSIDTEPLKVLSAVA